MSELAGVAAIMRRWGRTQAASALIALLAILLLATATSPLASDGSRIFLEAGNLTDVLRQVAIIGIIALGMTFVILTGGIDLSVGSVLALSTGIAAAVLTRPWLATPTQLHIAIAIGIAIAACAALGVANGLIIARLRVQPFVATLATMIGVRGLAKWLTHNENIDIGFGHDVAARFAGIFSTKGLVIGCYTLAVAVFWLLFSKTVFGRHVRAIGDNPTAAVYAGLPIVRTQIAVYGLAGALAGIAGVLYTAENHQGNANAGVGYELDAIAAAVIGGTNLAGGRGTIAGTLIGTLFMGVLTNLLRLNDVDSNVEMMIKAIVIIFAVALQRGERA